MRMFGYPVYLVYLYLVVGCATPKATTTSANTSTSASGGYSEDLSALRPKVEAPKDTVVPKTNDKPKTTVYVEPKYAVNEKLDAVLDSIDKINLAKKFVEGFTIQVYSGKREEALNTKKQ